MPTTLHGTWVVFHKYLLNEKVCHGQHIKGLNLSQFLVSFEVQLLLHEDKMLLLKVYFNYSK